MKNIKHYFKGFTLVELIIVITILAILATIAFISFQDYTKDARDANRVSTLKNIETWLELFTLKTWNFPKPDEAKVFTGWLNWKSQINQWVIWENVSKIIQMNKTPLDPKDSSNYVYSTFWNNKYYQIGIDSEQKEISFIPQTYAKSKTSIVKWNYKFDPSLPSLILVENEALMNSWIFSPEVCFVLDWGKNSLNECNEIKSEMNLKDFDSSLVGYWDMETTFNSWWIDYLKNLSGDFSHGTFVANWMNNAVITREKNVYDSWIIQNILPKEPQKVKGVVWWAFIFDGWGYFTINDNTNIFKNINYKNSITISAIIKDTWVVDDTLWCEQGKFYQTYAFSAYRYNLSNANGSIYALPNSKWTFFAWYQPEYFLNEYHLYTFTKNQNITSFYIDGKKINSRSINIYADGLTTYPFVWPFIWASKHCWWGTNINRFIGEIDEVKIFDSELTSEQILQQSKIAWF